MDVKVEKKPINKALLIKVIGALLLVLAIAWVVIQQQDGSIYTMNKSRLVTAIVSQGEFNIEVTAPGMLVPKKVNILSINVDGQVDDIYALPGTALTVGQSVLKLSNPKLLLELQELNWDREAMEAELEAEKAENKTELINTRNMISKVKNQYDMAKLEYDAYLKLSRQSLSSTSEIDMRKAELLTRQAKQSYQDEQQKFEQLEKSLAARIRAKEARLNKLIKVINQTEYQVEQLTVKSPVEGILQTLTVELGQQLVLGENVARVARTDSLKAELKVAEHQADSVAIGQQVTIDTRLNKLNGTVIRVDPAIIQGTVQVDVELNDALPKEARPDLSINANIHVSKKNNSRYVRRPVFSLPNKTFPIYRLDQNTGIAEKVDVNFGASSSTAIEILGGLNAGDEIVISEYTSFNSHERIRIESD